MQRLVIMAAIMFCMLTAGVADDVKELSAQQLDAALDQIEATLGELESLRAEFVQEKHLVMFDKPLTAKGVIYFQAPVTIRFELTEPFASVLIVRDDKVAKYEQVGDTWKRLRLGNPDALTMVMNQIAAWMQGRFREQSKIFSVNAAHRPEFVLILTPEHKQFRRIIKQIELTFTPEKDALRTVSIRQPDGDSTILQFADEVRNQEFPAALFEQGEVPQFPDKTK